MLVYKLDDFWMLKSRILFQWSDMFGPTSVGCQTVLKNRSLIRSLLQVSQRTARSSPGRSHRGPWWKRSKWSETGWVSRISPCDLAKYGVPGGRFHQTQMVEMYRFIGTYWVELGPIYYWSWGYWHIWLRSLYKSDISILCHLKPTNWTMVRRCLGVFWFRHGWQCVPLGGKIWKWMYMNLNIGVFHNIPLKVFFFNLYD